MPPQQNQRLVLGAVAAALGEAPSVPVSLGVNIMTADRELSGAIERLYSVLDGDWRYIGRSRQPLQVDGYLPGRRIFLEYDEFQHFTSARLTTLDHYPEGLPVGFDLHAYRQLCKEISPKADKYRVNKAVVGFSGPGARARQRAARDFAKDLYASLVLGAPVLRITEMEVEPILLAPDAAARELAARELVARKMGFDKTSAG